MQVQLNIILVDKGNFFFRNSDSETKKHDSILCISLVLSMNQHFPSVASVTITRLTVITPIIITTINPNTNTFPKDLIQYNIFI